MKISSNAVGNYSPYTNKVNDVAKTQKLTETKEVKNKEIISKEEKKFFTKMYPENKNEIVDYHFYKSSGKMSGVSVGSLFDRRG